MLRTLIGIAVLLSLTANAGTVVVSFVPPSGDEATIELRQLTRVADYDKPPIITRKVRLDEVVSLDLPPGHWALDVAAPSIWHQTQTFSVLAAAMAIEAPMLPGAEVTGHVATADKSELPKEIRLTFASEREGTVVCPVTDTAFRCHIPAGTTDLRLRAPGCVTRFFWRQNASHESPLDLGMVTLVRGATLVGRVDVERGSKIDLNAIHVRAKGLNESLDAAVGPRGVFHIDGIAPGDYAVAASGGPHLKSQTIHIEVKPFASAEMHDVLLLQKPKTLRVLVVPPFDPQNRPWRVELSRYVGRQLQRVTGSAASIGGEWSAAQLAAGKYELKVHATDESEWHTETVEIASTDLALNVAVPARVLHGVVTRAGNPVATHIELADAHSAISFDAGDDGRFSGAVPLVGEEWTATVKSETPPIRCRLEHLRATKRDDSGDVDLEIKLPNTAITGSVVDENGTPVSAMVNISGSTGLQQVRAADDGSFFVSGLPPGKYALEASAFLKQSAPFEVTLTETSADPVKLVVEDVEKIHGRVVSDFGPVPGAVVVITPTNVPARLVQVNWTDEAGEFSTVAPQGTREVNVLVLAPGYALKFFHSPMHRGLLTIPVDQSGGAIRVGKNIGDRAPYLVHNGAIESVEAMLWTSAAVEDGDALLVPSIDAGVYSFCMLSNEEASAARTSSALPGDRCRAGFLPPFGALSFYP